MFEWQSHSQKSSGVPHYQDILDCQATELHVSDRVPKKLNKPETHSSKKMPGYINSHVGSIGSRHYGKCSICDAEKHPLYACPKFKLMSHEVKMSTVKLNNCLGSGHIWKQCTSIHKCKVFQKRHHTLLHLDRQSISSTPATVTAPIVPPQIPTSQNGVPVNINDHDDVSVNFKVIILHMVYSLPQQQV